MHAHLGNLLYNITFVQNGATNFVALFFFDLRCESVTYTFVCMLYFVSATSADYDEVKM